MVYSILVVDDEKSIRELYEMELREEGYRVLCAHDSPTAMSILESEDVHALILDIKLNGESGLHLLQKITKKFKDRPPIILSTAYSSYKNDYSSWLADAYVVKSFDLKELKGQVCRVLKKHYGAGPLH